MIHCRDVPAAVRHLGVTLAYFGVQFRRLGFGTKGERASPKELRHGYVLEYEAWCRSETFVHCKQSAGQRICRYAIPRSRVGNL